MSTTLQQYLTDAAPFRPVAYHDANMDCIRIQFRDCSTLERRVDEVITLVFSNEDNTLVGLVVKGLGHLLDELGFDKQAVVEIASFLDSLIKSDPEREGRNEIEKVKETAAMTGLSFSRDLALAA